MSHLSGHNMQISNSSRTNGSKPAVKYTEYRAEGKGGFEEYSPTTINNKIESGTPPSQPSGRDSTEMDLEAMGVRVDKSYSLQSGNVDAIHRDG